MGFLIPRELTDRVETQITSLEFILFYFIFLNVKVDLYVVVETGYSPGEQTNTDN